MEAESTADDQAVLFFDKQASFRLIGTCRSGEPRGGELTLSTRDTQEARDLGGDAPTHGRVIPVTAATGDRTY
jgi:hypothetical protein